MSVADPCATRCILDLAARSDATVVSKDRFKEARTSHPWPREPNRLLAMEEDEAGGWLFYACRPA